jgi:hypothetical protein
VPLSEKMTNLPFFGVVSCIEPLLEKGFMIMSGIGWSKHFLDGYSSILDSV